MPRTPEFASQRMGPAWSAAAELSPAQRWALAGLAVAAHVVAGVQLLSWRDAPVPPELESAPLMVSMIAPEVRPPQAALSPPPAPVVSPTRPVVPVPTVLSSKAPSTNPLAAPPEVPRPSPKTEAAPVATPAPVSPAPVSAMATAPEAHPASAAPLPPKQINASAVRYLVPPQQVYPETSRRLGESGKVGLKVLVDEHGKAIVADVTQSSGFSRLDQAAVSAMKAARFQPYLENGVARSVWAPATITYDLQD